MSESREQFTAAHRAIPYRESLAVLDGIGQPALRFDEIRRVGFAPVAPRGWSAHMTGPLAQLSEQGVAIWVDSIARDWLEKGELRRLRDQFSVVGVTSNPTIFQTAMSAGTFYDEQLADLAHDGWDAPAIFERLALDDIDSAARELAPVHAATGGRDGFVSYEVAPDLARDTDRTTSEAARLFDLLGHPSVMIKIPATAEGLPAIQSSIARGINVNVTLIFSIERYRAVVEAYLSGLEARVANGDSIDQVRSVASFFVSRVDTLVDPLLAQRTRDEIDASLAIARLGTAAIDNAKLAYEAWGELFDGPRWTALADRGAAPQRCLWASTSAKNPEYRDVIYSEELIGRETVNTMPLGTIEAFNDHGRVRDHTMTDHLDRAHRLWADLARLDIDEAQVGQQLEDEGVEKFSGSYTAVLETVEAKRLAALA